MDNQRSLLPLFTTLLALLTCFLPAHDHKYVEATGTPDGMEEWGYVQVRPKAHMFWWLYRSPNRVDNGSNPWPTVLWLQGGPGASGTGYGNFLEIGPLDLALKPRNATWLKKADLLFVDSPVGTGYSYVEDQNLLVKTDEEGTTDLTILLKELYNNKSDSLGESPLYIASESYGGRFAVTLGLSLVKAVKAGELNLTLGGVALGDAWISPLDYVLSWGPMLRDVSRLDSDGLDKMNSLTNQIKQQIDEGRYGDATETMIGLQEVLKTNSNKVDFYNFLLDEEMDPIIALDSVVDGLMNGKIREKLMIIPNGVRWINNTYNFVYGSLKGDIMKPRIDEVDQLLSMGVNVTIYNGQLDVICATSGTEAWVQNLKWEGINEFIHSIREPLYCKADGKGTKGFYKSHNNLHFYWILNAGHFVPVDQPCIALEMLGEITRSPVSVGYTMDTYIST